MLQKIGVLTAEELQTLKTALKEIEELWKKGDFKVSPSQEDGHTAIEQYITEKYGDVGKKIHTGRSRNDQSMTMIRLYSLEQLREVKATALDLASAAEARLPKLNAVAMPGYTHMQRAMPTSVGTWLGSFAQGWKDAAKVLDGAISVLDQNPLGSAAGFGINGLALDREETAKLMGFAAVQSNPMSVPGVSHGVPVPGAGPPAGVKEEAHPEGDKVIVQRLRQGKKRSPLRPEEQHPREHRTEKATGDEEGVGVRLPGIERGPVSPGVAEVGEIVESIV
eukprot:s1479_g10.t1